jgi:geranylgeranyl diphosphate synthase, type II
MNLSQYLQEQGQRINERLDQLVPLSNESFKQLFEAARYSLLGKGKRIRPILALATCQTLGGNDETALTPVCALEFIHTYSLIHDDLPCMDNDDFRRGQPTLHKVYPESLALLTGDFLLTSAFGLLADAPALTSEQRVKLISVLAQGSGGHGMIGGQVMDIESLEKEINLNALKHIHQCKTGALMISSVEFGAILAHANENQVHILRNFSKDIGLAFQIIDDVLDVTSSEQKHGKAIASDVINKKTTYVSLLGLDTAKATAVKLFESAVNKLALLKTDTSLLTNLAKLIVYRQV